MILMWPPDEELNLTGALRQRLARKAREPRLIECAGRLTPARWTSRTDLSELRLTNRHRKP
jgi:hypothetical protein